MKYSTLSGGELQLGVDSRYIFFALCSLWRWWSQVEQFDLIISHNTGPGKVFERLQGGKDATMSLPQFKYIEHFPTLWLCTHSSSDYIFFQLDKSEISYDCATKSQKGPLHLKRMHTTNNACVHVCACACACACMCMHVCLSVCLSVCRDELDKCLSLVRASAVSFNLKKKKNT